jgi:hypothetical protein
MVNPWNLINQLRTGKLTKFGLPLGLIYPPFVFRAFNRALTDPMNAALEVIVGMFLFNMYWPLDLGSGDNRGIFGYKAYVLFILFFPMHIVISAVFRMLHKLEFVFCSFRNVCKRQQVRLSNWKIVVVLQLTILVPLVLAVTLWTGFLNIAMVPLFGFTWYVFSMPKPLRYWQEVTPSQIAGKADGYIFASLADRIHCQMQKVVASDYWNYDVGSFYLLKCNNMVMLMSVLERGQDYILYCLRGA